MTAATTATGSMRSDIRARARIRQRRRRRCSYVFWTAVFTLNFIGAMFILEWLLVLYNNL